MKTNTKSRAKKATEFRTDPPTKTIEKKSKFAADLEDCPVCQETRRPIKLGCSHWLCEECLFQMNNFLCPLCRDSFNKRVALKFRVSILRNIKKKEKEDQEEQERSSRALVSRIRDEDEDVDGDWEGDEDDVTAVLVLFSYGNLTMLTMVSATRWPIGMLDHPALRG